MTGKVAYIANHSERSDMIDVEGILREALRELKELKEWKPNKAILIFLEDDGKYDFIIYNAQMMASEVIALLSVVKRKYEEDLI